MQLKKQDKKFHIHVIIIILIEVLHHSIHVFNIQLHFSCNTTLMFLQWTLWYKNTTNIIIYHHTFNITVCFIIISNETTKTKKQHQE